MFRNTSLAAFLVTVAVIVPAGWHALRADIQTDGKRLRPLQQAFVMEDGTRITLDVDRQIVMTGATVKATLVAYNDTPKQVAVDLRALRSTNYEGSRVESPYVPFDRETIKLTASPGGGKPVETAIKLGELPDKPALIDDFKIFVTEHGKKLPRREEEDRVDYDSGISEGYAAAIAVTGWSGNNLSMKIDPEDRPTGDAPFTIAVHVKNTSGQRLVSQPYVSLDTEAALEGKEGGDQSDAAVEIAPISEDSDTREATAFERGGSMTKRFLVTPKHPGLHEITFLASAFESDEAPGPTTAGAREARTFTLSDAAPAMAAK
ncbi:MAG TPA: hypothetical protein VH165_02255 [Kofleriaceae bacterium]|jgi:hypothetical protein|nr:hypothetical protein [Kofleriaceae bacterium]